MSSSAVSGRMSNIRRTLLSERSVIAVSGDDARVFLQGLITNDVNKVDNGNGVFAVLLSPQGKFLYDFFITEHEGKLLLDIAKSGQDELIKRLNMYKLRSKVEIYAMPELRVAAQWGEALYGGLAGEILQGKIWEDAPYIIKYHDPRLPQLGVRVISANILDMTDTNEYNHNRLMLAIPEGNKDLTHNRSLPMEWAYDKLNAIDFNKGCYVGQEVTARSKHRATLRKMVHMVIANTGLPPYGTTIMTGDREVGHMASSEGSIGLAILDIETVNSRARLTCDGIEIEAKLPDWVTP